MAKSPSKPRRQVDDGRDAIAAATPGPARPKKGAAIAGGSKSKQGGVKQSGQEPLDVQKMDVLVMVAKA